jgi:hypothetical protein
MGEYVKAMPSISLIASTQTTITALFNPLVQRLWVLFSSYFASRLSLFCLFRFLSYHVFSFSPSPRPSPFSSSFSQPVSYPFSFPYPYPYPFPYPFPYGPPPFPLSLLS